MRICDLPPQPGDCGARYQRWFYNKNIKECMIFSFQGCRGNQNNFRSKEECEENCIAYFDKNMKKSVSNFQPVRSPRIVTEQFVKDQAVISTSPLVRSRATDPHQKELRRKRRLERKKLRQLKRKNGKKKRRRSGKGKKRKNRNRKNKKNKKKRRKNKKNKRRKKKLKATNDRPEIDLSNTDTKSKSNGAPDFELISIIDKTKDTMKSNIEKIKAEADTQKD